MEHPHGSKRRSHHLAIMTGLSFAAMFVLMHSMVDVFANVFVNVNQAYMAGLMAAPVVPKGPSGNK